MSSAAPPTGSSAHHPGKRSLSWIRNTAIATNDMPIAEKRLLTTTRRTCDDLDPVKPDTQRIPWNECDPCLSSCQQAITPPTMSSQHRVCGKKKAAAAASRWTCQMLSQNETSAIDRRMENGLRRKRHTSQENNGYVM